MIVESTGTGGGMKLFCGGVGDQFPDATDASRPIKASEYADCVKNGVKNVIELPVGIDGLTLIQAKDQAPLNLTVEQIYKGLAANPFGKGANTAQTWKDVDPSLPATKIRCSARRRRRARVTAWPNSSSKRAATATRR